MPSIEEFQDLLSVSIHLIVALSRAQKSVAAGRSNDCRADVCILCSGLGKTKKSIGTTFCREWAALIADAISSLSDGRLWLG